MYTQIRLLLRSNLIRVFIVWHFPSKFDVLCYSNIYLFEFGNSQYLKHIHIGRSNSEILCQSVPLKNLSNVMVIVSVLVFYGRRGWWGDAMVLGKLPVPGRPTNLDYGRARAHRACSRCGWGCLDIFSLVYHFSFLSISLWETA